ncbi:MAG: HAMP domain-containing protein, partial [Elusimicrobiota bacterium]|nr:HAMP domain-containing protein [Elusimicrobiota bacterium]
LKNAFNERLVAINRRLGHAIDVFVSENKVLMQTFLAAQDMFSGGGVMPPSGRINAFVKDIPSLNSIAFVNANGKESAYFGSGAKMHYQDILPAVKAETINGGNILIGSLRRNPARRSLLLTVAFPVSLASGFDGAATTAGEAGQNPPSPPAQQPTKGAAIAEFNMADLSKLIDAISIKDSLALIFTKSGFLIYSSEGGLSTTINNEYIDKIAALASMAKEGQQVKIEDEEDVGILSVHARTDWLIYVEQPISVLNDSIISSFKSSLRTFIYVILAIAILAFVLSATLASYIIKPVKVITKAVNQVEEGNVANLPPLPIPNNEIGALSLAFARMLDSTRIKIEDINQDRVDLEELNQSLELRVGSRTKELRTALNEMIKKERLAAIGQMASIVSHEIKNPLAVMANAVYLIKTRLGSDIEPRLQKNINVIEQEIKQANGIIEEILGFARTREQILTTVDISIYIKDILLSYPIPKNINLTTEYYPSPLYIHIDTEEIKQAVRNIIGNAIEVMPAGGQLVIKTKFEKGNAILSIRDTGPGIPKEVQDNIFTPFFTTKARGTGLGLAVVRKVAGRNNAEILLQSEVGKGTKMSLVFKKIEEA